MMFENYSLTVVTVVILMLPNKVKARGIFRFYDVFKFKLEI